MRGGVICLVFLLMAPIFSCALSSSSAENEMSIVIAEVCPAVPVEFLTIRNIGTTEVSLLNWTITDGEGDLTLCSDIILGPDDTLTITKNISAMALYCPDRSVINYTSESFTRKGTFTLANDGDQLSLLSPDGNVIDSFCYGPVTTAEGWDGDPYPKISNGNMVVRNIEMIGSGCNSSGQWSISVLGRSSFHPFRFTGSAHPILYPQDGNAQIIELINCARSTIKACIYTFEESAIAGALIDARSRGIEVELLIEGRPVGGLTSISKGIIDSLCDNGCKVHLMASNESYRRYDYVHAKYMVIDSSESLVSSENWGGGLGDNRGWAMVIRSAELAKMLESIFEQDFDSSLGDIRANPSYDVTTTGNYVNWTEAWNDRSYSISGNLLVSPDNSLSQIIELIRSAKHRVYIETMSFDYVQMSELGLADELIDAAKRGVDVRILLDQKNDPDGNNGSARMLIQASHGVPHLQVRLCSWFHEFSTIHNKGMIVDDQVLVSSINLVRNAFVENREIGVLLHSEELAGVFAQVFERDWAEDPIPPVIVLPSNGYYCREGESLLIDAGESYDNSNVANYTWDVDADGIVDAFGPRAIFSLPPGDRTIVLTVTDDHDQSASVNITVHIAQGDERGWPQLLLGLPVVGASVFFALRFVQKRIKS